MFLFNAAIPIAVLLQPYVLEANVELPIAVLLLPVKLAASDL